MSSSSKGIRNAVMGDERNNQELGKPVTEDWAFEEV